MYLDNCELIECDNPNSVGDEFVGVKDKLEIDIVFYFGSLRSSYIKTIEFKNDLITVQTKNTKYTFKILNKEL